MARRSEGSTDLDWYLISIARLKQIGMVLVLLLIGLAGYWIWSSQKENPRSAAESAIADAKSALNALAASKNFNTRRSEFTRAQQKLDEANALFGSRKYVEARDAAVESQTMSRSALSGGSERENDAQFIAVEGDVKYQKASSSEWKEAAPPTPLFNGDWVKTGDRASAELMFSNGSVYTVGPNALLEIFAVTNPATSKKTNAVQMKVGSVEVATIDESSAVRTPGTHIVIESESTTHVGVDGSTNETQVIATKGAAAITSDKSGQAVRLGSGDKITSSATGDLSAIKKLAMPPALLEPADNAVLQFTPDLRVEFVWDKSPTAAGYLLQVSRSRLFATREIDSQRTATSAKARVTSEGAFYWRVASLDAEGDPGPFSPFRRFRVTGGGKVTSADTTAPPLTLKTPFKLGGQFYMIAGTTEPGATVFINDEEADVESSGAFQKLISFEKTGRNAVVVKAVDAAGNQTVQSQTVLVEE